MDVLGTPNRATRRPAWKGGARPSESCFGLSGACQLWHVGRDVQRNRGDRCRNERQWTLRLEAPCGSHAAVSPRAGGTCKKVESRAHPPSDRTKGVFAKTRRRG